MRAETGVGPAYDGNDGSILAGTSCTNGRRQGKPHRPQTTGSYRAATFVELIIAGCRHLMLPNIGHDDGFAFAAFG